MSMLMKMPREQQQVVDLDGRGVSVLIRPRGGAPHQFLSASVPPINRRGGRNAAAKKEGIVSETIEPDGHLPGFKDGVGCFPRLSQIGPRSCWRLKLKGAVFLHLFLF